MLERYRLGELSPGELGTMNSALEADQKTGGRLHKRLLELEESDRELRLRFPLESLGLPEAAAGDTATAAVKNSAAKIKKFPRVYITAAIAAAVVLCIILPVLFIVQNSRITGGGTTIAALQSGDRPKGSAGAELSVYLKGDQQTPLPDQSVLTEGNTVQLAYTANTEPQAYGVIFSIDGRSQVTMHYPYSRGQSPLLVSGRRTFLTEAYTLDDAPGYELFVMVISDKPLDTEAVLAEAGKLAGSGTAVLGAPVLGLKALEEKSLAAFRDCKVIFAAILKK